ERRPSPGGIRKHGQAPVWNQTGIVARLGGAPVGARRSAERAAGPRVQLHHRRRARLLARRGHADLGSTRGSGRRAGAGEGGGVRLGDGRHCRGVRPAPGRRRRGAAGRLLPGRRGAGGGGRGKGALDRAAGGGGRYGRLDPRLRRRRPGLARIALQPAAHRGGPGGRLRGAPQAGDDRGGGQHLRHAAQPAAARPRRHRVHAVGHQVHRRPLRPAGRGRHDGGRCPVARSPQVPRADRRHTRNAGSLPGRPRREDSGPAPGTRPADRHPARGAARSAPARRPRPLSGPALPPDARGRQARAQGLRHHHLLRRRWRGRAGGRGLPEREAHPPRHQPGRRGIHHGTPRRHRGTGTPSPFAPAAQRRHRGRRRPLGGSRRGHPLRRSL
ncbi:MAG: Cystathionine gamma-synthase, partial [uncultured Gemmatimonadetes bacterium]